MLLFAGVRTAHARDAAGRADLVDIARPAVVEHPFVAPLVAEFLDQCGNEVSYAVIGSDRRLRIKLLHRVDDRRRVLNADALGRNHQGDDRHPGMLLVFRLACRIPQNPLMRNAFVAKIGAHLDRVGRHLGPEDAIAVSHELSSDWVLDGLSPALSGYDVYHLTQYVRDRSAASRK